jgi:5-formyltetrahydrofolate cyclo-ligase
LRYRVSQKLQNAATFAQSAKIVARILRRKIERIIEDLLGEDQFGFRIGKGSGYATAMLRIITG